MFNLKIKNDNNDDNNDIEALHILSYETSIDPNDHYCVFVNFYSDNKKISYNLRVDEIFKTASDIKNSLDKLLNKVTKKHYILNIYEYSIRSYISIWYDNSKNTTRYLQFTGTRQVL
jgi:hypothetical protein